MQIQIKKLSNTAKLPMQASSGAAGYDLFADFASTPEYNNYLHAYSDKDNENVQETVIIPPHTSIIISTGISVVIPEGYFGGVYARGGIAAKEGLRPANCVGVVDSDYRGPIMVAIRNDSNTTHTISNGQRIAQLVIQKHETIEFEEVDELPVTERQTGAFGSTGEY